MKSRALFALGVGLTILIATLVTFRMAPSQGGEPAPAAIEAATGGGGLTAPPEPPAPAASRASRTRRPADPDRGADPGNAPVLKHFVETKHYLVSSEISKEVCEEAAALLELAWPIWCRRFDLAEDYDAGPGLFPVRIYESEQRLYQLIHGETGEWVPCLGYVPFRDYRLFACRHPRDYEFRRILLHEGTHQFLYRLIGSPAARRLPRWYDEGCAHESEKHVLDGDRLELFQHTGGVFSGQVGTARRFFANSDFTRAWLNQGSDGSSDHYRACGWAFVHFMRNGASPEERVWFAEFEAALHSGSRARRADVVSELGDTEDLTRRILSFLDQILVGGAPKPESRK